MKIFADFTPVVEPLSLDEAFLDVSGALGLFGRPAEIARQIRRRIFDEQQLTCSVGIAPIKSVAKLASGSCKPNGLRVVSRDGLFDFLHPLPVTALWGVGRATAEPLRRLGIRTVAELAQTPVDTLRRAVGSATASHLHNLANGRDDRVVSPRSPEKSISTDRTLLHDLLTEADVARELLRGAGEVSERLRHLGRTARTVGIKIRFADFTTLTRVRTLAEPTDSSSVVYAASLELYRGLGLDRPRVRLVGVKVENLRPAGAATQLALAWGSDQVDERNTAADQVVDALAARFPDAAVGPATLLRAQSHVDHAVRNMPAESARRQVGDNKSHPTARNRRS
jgi:DNA polymerase-4